MEKIFPDEPVKVGTGLVLAAGIKNMGANPPTHVFAKLLNPQRYAYKFRVDGNWRYAPDQMITKDEAGNQNNVIDLTNSKTLIVCLQ